MRSSVRKAHEQIAALRAALLRGGPVEIEQCLPGLEEAGAVFRHLGEALATIQPGSRDERDALREEVQALRHELTRAARLVEHGDLLWRGWARILGSAAGYTAAGEPAPLRASGQLSVQG
jgi:hypothetical protein